ncbi:ATP-binding protein [Rubrivivax rivuli]|uniref:Tetratricopeptide repeat protein n=1 Tax=Rubrivivax rivuli TaxID=1862385 RepID=A0A437R9D6_9BURK|nr:tetratricopeptide repeat protein [Rubrivivax rivuli]RVU43317.1 tetratricopeptide repeat protein [Rubrivivax rivuli]
MPQDLTLLFTDIEGSTAVNARLGDAAMSALWALHDRGSRDLLQAWRGREVDRSDGLVALFDSPADAAGFATAYHRMLAALPEPLRARAGLHTGPLDVRQNAPEDVALGAKPVEAFGIGKAVGARLMALARGGQTLASSAAAAQLQTAGWQTLSHGHWRMKGLPEPLEVHEVGDDSAPWLPPPDAEKSQRVVWHRGQWMGGDQVPHNLPAERDRFVGRQADLRALALLLEGPARLVTLHGTGGMGKTRLALRHAWAWRGNFPGGVWFCDLAQARNLDSVLQAVAVALDVPLGADPVAQLGRAIAGRERCLLILDNFEQVTRHAPETVGRWLDMAPQAHFVATSREVLGLRGEHTLALDALSTDEAAELFHERAQAALAGYQRDAESDRAVRQLVELLDGLPLAIELAAPRVRVMAPAQLLARMGDRFRLLAVQGSTGRQDRQATLQNALQWSWELMSAPERRTLAQLAVFEGGFDWPAAEAVVSLDDLPEAPWLVDLLQALGDKSLLRRLPGTRFGLLRAVQAFALTHLSADEQAAVRTRHARYYAALDEQNAIARGGVELDNLVQACRHAVACKDAATAAASLGLVWLVLRLTGPLRAAADLAQEVRAGLALQGREAAAVGWVEGVALVGSGRTAEAQAVITASLATHPAPGGDLLGGRLHGALGDILSAAGDTATATLHLQTALATGLRLQNTGLQCQALNELGAMAMNAGDHPLAQSHFTRALRIATEAEDRRWLGGLQGNLGALNYAVGRFAEAREAYEQALRLARDTGDRRWEANHLCNLGLVYLRLEDTGLAEQAMRESLALARDIGHARIVPAALCNLGHVLAAAGKAHEARSALLEAQALAREANDQRLFEECQGTLDTLPPETAVEGSPLQFIRD